jgi:RNA polymerase sigma-70 factor (ECF subfamily)
MAGENTAARASAPVTQAEQPGSVGGNIPSFAAIYSQYFDFVWSSVKRLGVSPEAVDDVVQEVFVVIHSRLHTVQRPDSLRSWVYGVARRTVSGYHRSRRAKEAAGLGSSVSTDSIESHQPTPFERSQQNDQVQLLARLVSELDEAKREVFVLAELEEMTVPEIAQALEIPLNTAYSRLRAARQAFEQALARHTSRDGGGGPV